MPTAAVLPGQSSARRIYGMPPIGVGLASRTIAQSGEESVERFSEVTKSIRVTDVLRQFSFERVYEGFARLTALPLDVTSSITGAIIEANASAITAIINSTETISAFLVNVGATFGHSVTLIGGEILPTFAALNALRDWGDNWNGYGASAPTQGAIKNARHWITMLYIEVLESPRHWIAPNVTADSGGEVVLGWWQGQRELSVYVKDDGAEYIKVWGTSVTSDMTEGNAESAADRRELWQWLTGE